VTKHDEHALTAERYDGGKGQRGQGVHCEGRARLAARGISFSLSGGDTGHRELRRRTTPVTEPFPETKSLRHLPVTMRRPDTTVERMRIQ